MERTYLLAALCLINIGSVELLSPEQRNFILKYHNEKRRTVSPPAASMPDMVYDENLEYLAQKWVDKCVYDHPSKSDVEYQESGQNIGVGGGNTVNESIKAILDLWYFEKDNYDYDANWCAGFCYHYTQMVWNDTTRIGCALKKCRDLLGDFESDFIACQYVKRGNIHGRWPYERLRKAPAKTDWVTSVPAPDAIPNSWYTDWVQSVRAPEPSQQEWAGWSDGLWNDGMMGDGTIHLQPYVTRYALFGRELAPWTLVLIVLFIYT